MSYKKERLSAPVVRDRHARAAVYREEGINPFAMLNGRFKYNQTDSLLANMIGKRVTVLGRARMVRNGGKIAFVKIDPGVSASSLYDKTIGNLLQAVGERESTPLFNKFRKLHLGDIIAVTGIVRPTDAGEISVFVDDWQFLSKNIRPLPDKHHGLTDVEERYRQRYADMTVNDEPRRALLVRAKVLLTIREVLNNQGFIEVETPTLHHTKGGAAAAAFETHYNSLNEDVILRIAPELYLKRLVVGGMNRVYEIGKNFRNEGLDRTHNPEFTSVEFYVAYEDYHYLISLCTELLVIFGNQLTRDGVTEWNGHTISLRAGDITSIEMIDLISEVYGIDDDDLLDEEFVAAYMAENYSHAPNDDWGRSLLFLFEERCEEGLIHPTFITGYPASVSPLARPNDEDPRFVDRFELFMGGVEVANAFNELANPETQYERFADQIAQQEAGDKEAMDMDIDYVNALEYGLPPTAGCGIGIDRLVMIITGHDSIKDVIAFPHLRKRQ